MFHLLLAAMAALSFQFQVQVNNENLTGTPDKAQEITMPAGSRYTCTRLPVQRDEDSATVLVGCKEGNKPAFLAGSMCRTDAPDANVTILVVNSAKPNEKPILTRIFIGCRTVLKQEIL